VYYRPPTHLNPIQRSVTSSFPFPEVYHGEDTLWALEIVKSGVLKKEYEITSPYYYYLFDPSKSETLRHMKRR